LFLGLLGFDDTFMDNGTAGIKWEDVFWTAFCGIYDGWFVEYYGWTLFSWVGDD
jgi:hypothetical protein